MQVWNWRFLLNTDTTIPNLSFEFSLEVFLCLEKEKLIFIATCPSLRIQFAYSNKS